MYERSVWHYQGANTDALGSAGGETFQMKKLIDKYKSSTKQLKLLYLTLSPMKTKFVITSHFGLIRVQ